MSQKESFKDNINNIITDLLNEGTYTDFMELQDNKTCHAHTIFLEQELQHRFKKLELKEFGSQLLFISPHKYKPCKTENCDGADEEMQKKKYGVEGNLKSKGQICRAIAVYYVRIFNILSAIMVAIDPENNMCIRRMRALYKNINEESFKVEICGADKELYPEDVMKVEGIQELVGLYQMYNVEGMEEQNEKVRAQIEQLQKKINEYFNAKSIQQNNLNDNLNNLGNNEEENNLDETEKRLKTTLETNRRNNQALNTRGNAMVKPAVTNNSRPTNNARKGNNQKNPSAENRKNTNQSKPTTSNLANSMGNNRTKNKVPPSGLPNTPGAMPGGLPNTPGAMPGGLPNTPGAMPGGLPNTPGAMPGGLPNTPGAMPGGLPNTPGAMPGGLPNTPGAMPGSLPNTPAAMPGGLPNTPGAINPSVNIERSSESNSDTMKGGRRTVRKNKRGNKRTKKQRGGGFVSNMVDFFSGKQTTEDAMEPNTTPAVEGTSSVIVARENLKTIQDFRKFMETKRAGFPKDMIKDGSPMKLSGKPADLSKTKECKATGNEAIDREIKKNDESFSAYIKNYNEMNSHYKSSKEKLKGILMSLIKKSEVDGKFKLKDITSAELSKIEDETRETLLNYYSTCQKLFIEGFNSLNDGIDRAEVERVRQEKIKEVEMLEKEKAEKKKQRSF